ASESASAAVNVLSNAANVDTEIALAGPGSQATFGSVAPNLGGTLANIQGSVGIQGAGVASIVVDDSGDTSAHPQAVLSSNSNNGQLSGLAGGTLYFDLPPATPVSILGGSSDDTFAVADPLPATGITIDGGGGTNTLVGPNTANTWAITGS